MSVRAGRVCRVTTTYTSGTAYGATDNGNSADLAPLVVRPRTIVMRGSHTGGDDYDTTPHLILESFPAPRGRPYGESVRFYAKSLQAKTMLAWYSPVDPTQPWDEITNPVNTKADAWFGSHYYGQRTDSLVHGHVSIEVPMANSDPNSRFGVDWINQATKARGDDKTHAYFASTDLTDRQGDVVMLDEDDTLKPVRIDPVVVPATEIAAFAEKFGAELAEQEQRLNSLED
jgi:hypothetical protein